MVVDTMILSAFYATRGEVRIVLSNTNIKHFLGAINLSFRSRRFSSFFEREVLNLNLHSFHIKLSSKIMGLQLSD